MDPVTAREVVRCPHCQLVQFQTANGNCRKCRKALAKEIALAPAVKETGRPAGVRPVDVLDGRPYDVGIAVWVLRKAMGLSGRQLATRMNVPRTYITKVENDKATPTLRSLARLSESLGVPVYGLVEIAVHCRNGRAA